MRNKIYSLFAILTASLLLTSCMKDEETDKNNVTYGDTAITAFSLGTLNQVCHTVNKAGGDSTYTTTFKAEAYKFYIDQAQGLIYNPDSLPYGIDIAHVLAKTSAKNGGIVSIKSTTDESLKYFSEKDSTDFTNPRTLIVTSRDGKSYRQYKVTVNAHKQQGDVFSWSTMPASADLEQLDGHKAVAFGGKVFVFGNKDGLTHGYYTAEGDGQTWTQLPTTFAADTYKGVIAHENNLYLVENGVVKRSADGLTWTSVSSTSLARLVAETKTELYGLSTAGTLYVSKDNGVSWAAEELDDEASKLPNANFGYIAKPLTTNSTIECIMMVGTSGTQPNAVVWTKLVDQQSASNYKWSFVEANNAYSLPNYTDLTLLNYDDKALAMGIDNGAFAKILSSEDGGITWKRFTKFAYPADATVSGSFAATVDSQQYIWLISGGKVWRGRLNSAGWIKGQTAFTE